MVTSSVIQISGADTRSIRFPRLALMKMGRFPLTGVDPARSVFHIGTVLDSK